MKNMENYNKQTHLISFLRDSNGIWNPPYVSAPGLIEVFKNHFNGTPIKGIEIGVANAWNMVYFLDNIPNLHITGIDPFLPYMDWVGMIDEKTITAQYEVAMDNLSKYISDNRALFYREKCEDIKNNFLDLDYDYIFIDGDHSYEAVARDLKNYYSKVKPGGIISGHDYHLLDVQRAVSEFRQTFSGKNIPPLNFTTNSVWFWKK